jgi:ribose-phosphate pyrophosphokinase
MKILVCNSNPPLSNEICKILKQTAVDAEIKSFSDGEIFVEIKESLRGQDVFIIQSTSAPVNDNLMELLASLDAVRRASAKTISVVMPYFGYARQDRKVNPRTPITAKLVANLIQVAGADHIFTIDLHAGQIQGFFDIPVDNLYAQPIFISHLKNTNWDLSEIVITSPDIGGIARARAAAKKIDSPIAIIDKRREKAGVSEVMNIIGDVKGKVCVIIDDIVDSAGTLCNAAESLINEGAKSVIAYISHGVLSGAAIERIANSKLEKLYITNSINPKSETLKCDKIEVLSVAPLIAEVIRRIMTNTGISTLSE